METCYKIGLAPLLCADPVILILGSLPGDESLRRQEYYGNPNNMFWDVLSDIFNERIGHSYDEKKRFLDRHHITLWDTIAAAEREGSRDSNIRGETYNDIAGLLASYPSIHTIVLNGGKAARAFKKYLRTHPEAGIHTNGCRILEYTSTSRLSVSAGWPMERVARQWKGMLEK